MLGANTLQACPLVLQLYISCFVIFVRHLKECHEIKYLFLLWIDKDVLDVKLLSPIYLDLLFEVTILAVFTLHGSSDPIPIFFFLPCGTDRIWPTTCKQEKNHMVSDIPL